MFSPFVTRGYVSAEYFCDRENETKMLTQYILGGNNVVMMAHRRVGKTGLIEHTFVQPSIRGSYYTFFVDIYATKNYTEFVTVLGKSILQSLKPFGRAAWEKFVTIVSSLRPYISYDAMGTPSLGMSIDMSATAPITLDEIFRYLALADKPCVVAIDEFQTICDYPQKNIEAELRTYIQHCANAQFIFSGSKRRLIGEMFTNSSRPFYQSSAMMDLEIIPLDKYTAFAQYHFETADKHITAETIATIYQRYRGITWYMQFVLNMLFISTSKGETCVPEDVDAAIDVILSQMNYNYQSTLFYLPSRQKEVLLAICNEGVARNITSRAFMNRYHLSASAIQGALKGLLDKDFITEDLGEYRVYDLFFEEWIKRNV